MRLFKRQDNPKAAYYFEFTVAGKKHRFCTKTRDRRLAQQRGEEHRQAIIGGNFSLAVAQKTRQSSDSLAEVAKRYKARVSSLPMSTRTKNLTSLLRILRANGLTLDAPISVLTAKLIKTYNAAVLDRAYEDETAKRRAMNTAVSTLRMARSIFAGRHLWAYSGVTLPDLTGFMTEPALQPIARVYTPPPASLVDEILDAAETDLRPKQPKVYAAFLLATYGGLRMGEVVHARWDWLGEVQVIRQGKAEKQAILKVQADGEWVPKGKAERVIALHPEVVEKLLATKVEGTTHMLGEAPWGRERTAYVKLSRFIRKFLPAAQWQKSSHELRKLFGSRIATEHGIYAASSVLGHQNVSTTERYYASLLNLPGALAPLR